MTASWKALTIRSRFLARRELARHRRQRHGDNRAVEHSHADRHGEGQEGEQALRVGKAVLHFDGVGRGYRFWAIQGDARSTGMVFAAVKPPFPTNRRRQSGRS